MKPCFKYKKYKKGDSVVFIGYDDYDMGFEYQKTYNIVDVTEYRLSSGENYFLNYISIINETNGQYVFETSGDYFNIDDYFVPLEYMRKKKLEKINEIQRSR